MQEHCVLSKACFLEKLFLPQPKLLAFFQSLTDLGEGKYPFSASFKFAYRRRKTYSSKSL
jgi:hypothetical protein